MRQFIDRQYVEAWCVFHIVEPLQGSSHPKPSNSQGGAATPLTLGCGMQPLRGIRLTTTN